MPNHLISANLMTDFGTLYVVATPIGNIEDITQRAINTLKAVDQVAAEDTRVARKLFAKFEIDTPILSYHDHNEDSQSKNIINKLTQGQDLALISDAGTPLINDPGYTLVRQCRQQGISVVPIPGVSAVITALSAAGVATDKFYYGGFTPAKQKARQDTYSDIAQVTYTSVFYESPHRIMDSLKDLITVLGAERHIVIARELTKTFETFLSGPAEQVLHQVEADPNQRKGEFVLIIEGNEQAAELDNKAIDLLNALLPHMALKHASAIVAETFGLKKKQVYQYGLEQNQ